ncbi:hypothetical protein SHKM778_74960 [Streptomyces sp. KM77-8]|uniref:DedA family protein n=1 Tax=Streptomyces haneummycinicus TaxID=3074435 RepID=A0AAT9HUI6_9ACTN
MESLGSLVGSPWIYAVVALSVLLDVFLPVLPSGILVITAATAAAAGTAADVPDILVLTLCAATASVLGDLMAYRLAWLGGPRLNRAIARSRRLRSAQERLGAALARGGGALVVLARFAPAGRSVVSSAPAPPATAPATSSLVRPGGPHLGRLQRRPRLLRRALAGRDLAGDGGVGGRAVRRGGGSDVLDAPPPD